TKGRTGSVAGRSGASSGAGIGIDRDALLRKLVKLTSSREDAVALDATKTLLTLVK
ncbi:MAG: hypothetical protein JWM98_1168, partial [Thermoleophilia bacterium]|nr:hypothetical protein [Thermoleophilia bacterium]